MLGLYQIFFAFFGEVGIKIVHNTGETMSQNLTNTFYTSMENIYSCPRLTVDMEDLGEGIYHLLKYYVKL